MYLGNHLEGVLNSPNTPDNHYKKASLKLPCTREDVFLEVKNVVNIVYHHWTIKTDLWRSELIRRINNSDVDRERLTNNFKVSFFVKIHKKDSWNTHDKRKFFVCEKIGEPVEGN